MNKKTAKTLKVVGTGLVVIGGILDLIGYDEGSSASSIAGPGLGRLGGQPSDPMNRLLPANKVPLKSTTHQVKNINERVGYICRLILRGSESPKVRDAVAQILNKRCGTKWCVPPKDANAEVAALYQAVTDPRSKFAVRYTRDHRELDQFHSADKLMKMNIGDCFVYGTRVLRDDHKLVPIESLRIGDHIWGYDRWSLVTNTWERGQRKTWNVRLNNGSSMRLTSEHKVFVARCRHNHKKPAA